MSARKLSLRQAFQAYRQTEFSHKISSLDVQSRSNVCDIIKDDLPPTSNPFLLGRATPNLRHFLQGQKVISFKKIGSFTADECEHAQTFVTKLKMIYCHYKSIFTWSSNSEFTTWCLQGQKVIFFKVLESFTAILKSTLDSVPQGVFSWPADEEKVDNFKTEIKHGLDARRFHSPRIEAIGQSCRHAVKLSRAFLVSK